MEHYEKTAFFIHNNCGHLTILVHLDNFTIVKLDLFLIWIYLDQLSNTGQNAN